MPLSDKQRAKMLHATRPAAHALLDDLQHIRQVIAAEGASPGQVRRLSGVLRRILVERELAEVAAPRIGKLELTGPDNSPVYHYARTRPLLFFASGRGKVFGWGGAIVAVYTPVTKPLTPTAISLPPRVDVSKTVTLRLDNFLSQNVLCLRGKWISRKATLKYVANVSSGVHTGTPSDPDDVILAYISRSTHVRLNNDGTIHLELLEGLGSMETTFKPLAKDTIDPVLIELLATAYFVSISPDVIRLEKIIQAEFAPP